MSTPRNPQTPFSMGGDLVNNILDQILTTRLQRKGKTVISSSVEFLMSIIVMAFGLKNIEFKHQGYEIGIYIMTGTAIAFILSILLTTWIYSRWITPGKKTTTKKEVEDAYTQTNKSPMIDGLLELPFPARFKGKSWWLPYLMWSLAVAIAAPSITLFVLEREALNGMFVATIALAGMLMYQIVGDFSEFWVLSRNQVDIPEDKKKEEGYDDNA